jgi:hypothetical protein
MAMTATVSLGADRFIECEQREQRGREPAGAELPALSPRSLPGTDDRHLHVPPWIPLHPAPRNVRVSNLHRAACRPGRRRFGGAAARPRPDRLGAEAGDAHPGNRSAWIVRPG